jgi:CelD/BcsL family acetyltransferase involved in cellulose biosynthesis
VNVCGETTAPRRTTGDARYDDETLDAAQALASPELAAAWKNLLERRAMVNAMYASPEWVGHLELLDPGSVRVVVLRTAGGELAGVAPLRLRRLDLQYAIGTRTLCKRRRPVDELLGGELVVRDRGGGAAALVEAALRAAGGRALYFDALQLDGAAAPPALPCRLPPSTYLYAVDGPRPWRLAQLAPSFEEFLSGMTSKARANLRREVRLLAESAGGRLELREATTEADAPEFLRDAAAVSRKSWQHRALGPRIADDNRGRRTFVDLASRGLLRAFVLKAGDVPCAFVVGYQYGSVYHYAEIGFDEAFTQYSPGKVLLYLLLEALHQRRRPELVNFGVGDASYKIRFGNVERFDASCLVLKSSVANRLVTEPHRAFNQAVKVAKRLIGRRVTK